MKIAIVGAGFAGLAAAWHLSQLPSVKITVFDALPIGRGTSGMAAGLLHTYAGLHAKKNWRGDEGLDAALPLLKIASKALGEPVYSSPGLLRIALNATAIADYRSCAEKYDDVEWVENCRDRLSDLPDRPGIFIHNAHKVYGELYLKGLWKACVERGITFIQARVDPQALLESNDLVVAATGGETPTLNRVKGQLLVVQWPEGLAPLPFPLMSQYYIAMDRDPTKCFVGGTYERPPYDPDPRFAEKELWPKALELYPPLEKGTILEVKEGFRSTTPNHHPVLKEVEKGLFLFAGLGSKGLLYSALYAQELASRVVQRL